MEYNEVKEGDKYIGGVENEGKKKNRFNEGHLPARNRHCEIMQ